MFVCMKQLIFVCLDVDGSTAAGVMAAAGMYPTLESFDQFSNDIPGDMDDILQIFQNDPSLQVSRWKEVWPEFLHIQTYMC